MTEDDIMPSMRRLIAACLLCLVEMVAGAGPARSASNCPTQTYLRFDHLAYVAVGIPAAERIAPGSRVGSGTVDEPTSADGCQRAESTVPILRAGSIDPRVGVIASGRPRTLFVIGYRCAGFDGAAYWDCLLRPLVFAGQRFTGTSYPSNPPPRRTLALGAAIGTADYHGRPVTVRRIRGVDPSLAVGISGQPSTAFLSPRTCPYGGFSNLPEDDNLLRCLHSPVWFTFDPPGSDVGGTVVARADRALPAAAAGAALSLVQLPAVADVVPPHHGRLIPVGHVAEQLDLRVPDVAAGLYEAVVTCARCGSRSGGGGPLYPAGSILVTAKPKTSAGIRIVSYALAAAFIAAVIVSLRIWRRRRLPTGSSRSGRAGS